MWNIVRLEVIQVKYEEINKIETKSTCLHSQKEKTEYSLLNIKASQKLTQNTNCLGIFFTGRVEHMPNQNLAIFGFFLCSQHFSYIIFGSFSK